MKKAILYSPELSSTNLGDKIIAESAKENLHFVLDNAFIVEVATQLPQSYYHMRNFRNMDFKFVLGSNLLKSTFFGFKRQWDITLRLSKVTGPCILMGAGWWQYDNKPNLYTKILLQSVLSKRYIHSVRDDYTLEILKSIGINNVINTSCPTMWKLTKDHCQEIKKEKSRDVIFTITDYNRNIEKDSAFIKILLKKYGDVYFWPQGLNDYEYLNSLVIKNDRIKVLAPSLEAFNKILEKEDIDYVGTRLHGGIKALQKKVRTIIIAIDNRAKEKHKSFNIPIVDRHDIEKLDQMIDKDFKTEIEIPLDRINEWKRQFES